MDIQKLTKEQAVIISGFTGILCGEFSDFHADVEKRLGRGVQTFEFGLKEFATEVKKLYEADFIEMGTVDKEQAKAQAVPDLGELQERIAGHQYYHDEHGHMIVDMDDVVKEISGFDSWKALAVPEGFVVASTKDLNIIYDQINDWNTDWPLVFELFNRILEAQEPAND